MKRKREKVVIGGLEDMSLPQWGIPKIRARVDTGARISSVHAENIKRLPGGRISFDVMIGWKKNRKKRRVVTNIKRSTTVRPSTGKQTIRWVVETAMKLGPIEKKIEISLANRQQMAFRFLLGRSAIGKAFLVDPAHHCLLSKLGERR